MGIDRFVRWKKDGKHPSLDDIRVVLEDYLGDVLMSINTNGSHLTVVIKGTPRFPFRRIHGSEHLAMMTEQHSERWFEVYWEKTKIDVVTRQTDEFTGVVADGFAELCRRFWGGTRDRG